MCCCVVSATFSPLVCLLLFSHRASAGLFGSALRPHGPGCERSRSRASGLNHRPVGSLGSRGLMSRPPARSKCILDLSWHTPSTRESPPRKTAIQGYCDTIACDAKLTLVPARLEAIESMIYGCREVHRY